MDKGLITQLQILKLSNIKPNFSELARLYDLDRRTVKRYYDGYEGKPKHHNKSSRLDEHYDLIKTKLSLRGANVRAVYEYIKDEVDSSIGTYSNFNKYVKSKGLKPKKTEKGHPRYETDMGVQAQVDWKEDVTLHNRYGEPFTFQVFDYKLGYSRYPVFTYKLYKTRQDVFDCLIASLRLPVVYPEKSFLTTCRLLLIVMAIELTSVMRCELLPRIWALKLSFANRVMHLLKVR